MNAPRFGASEALAAGVVAALVLAWVVSAGRVPAYLLPPPLDVLRAVAGFFTQPERLEHLVATFAHIGASIALSFVLGAALAFAAHELRWSAVTIHGQRAQRLVRERDLRVDQQLLRELDDRPVRTAHVRAGAALGQSRLRW